MSNLARMRKDLGPLILDGHQLLLRMLFDLFPDDITKQHKKTKAELQKELPSFEYNYQRWSDRVSDLKAYYQLPRRRLRSESAGATGFGRRLCWRAAVTGTRYW